MSIAQPPAPAPLDPPDQSSVISLRRDEEQTFLRPRRAARRDWFRAGFFATLGAGLFALLALIAWRLSSATLAVIAPFVEAFALALLLDPLVDWLQRRCRMPRLLAVSLVFIALLLILGGALYYAIPALVTQATNLTQNAPGFIDNLRTHVNAFLTKHQHIGTYALPKNFNALSARITEQAGGVLQKSSGGLTGYLMGSIKALLDFVVMLILTFYLLMDIDRLRARFFYLIPQRWCDPSHRLGTAVGQVFSGYLRGMITIAISFGVTTTLILYGMSYWHHAVAQYALIIGVVAGIIVVIPYLGALTTGLLVFLVAFPAGGLGFGLLGLVLITVEEQVFDNIITPRIVGGSVGLHPVLALFALFICGALFGFWGLILAVPIVGSIQAILFQFFPHLKSPTAPVFLREQGVPPDKGRTARTAKTPSGHSPDAKEKQEPEAEEQSEDRAAATD